MYPNILYFDIDSSQLTAAVAESGRGGGHGQAQTKIAKQIAKTHDHFILYLSLSFVKISDSEWISIIK